MNKQDKGKALEIAMGLIESKQPTLDKCVESAMKMSAWKEQQMIEKAVEWLENNIIGMMDGDLPYTQSTYDMSKNEFIEDFKKAMEGDL